MTDPEDRVTALVNEADALVDVKRSAEAIERAREAASLAPGDPRPFRSWSRALYGTRQYRDAAGMAGESIRLAPNDPVGYRLRSRALSTLARQCTGGERATCAEAAVLDGRQAVRLLPADPNGHLVLAEALSLAKAHAEAEAEVQAAIRTAPNSPATWVTASLVALAARNWPRAIEASRHALALDPNNYAALNNLGVALRASGRRREGTEVLGRAARVDPDAPTARANLSRAGIRVARVAILVVLLPIGFLVHAGILLYLVFAVGSNVVISRRPDLVLRFERWAAPLALFVFRRRRRNADDTGLTG